MYLSPLGEVTPPLSQLVGVLLVSLLQLVVLVLCQHHLLLILWSVCVCGKEGGSGRVRVRVRGNNVLH